MTGGDTARPSVAFRPARVEALMGFDVDETDQRRYLEGLGFGVTPNDDGDTWTPIVEPLPPVLSVEVL